VPPIWQQSYEEYVKPCAERAIRRGKEKWRAYSACNRTWEWARLKALSDGLLTYDEVCKTRERPHGCNQEWETLPKRLYHATTAKSCILEHGPKPRCELNRPVGLGGGPSETISYTADRKTGEDIKRALLEARAVATGRLTAAKLVEMAKKGVGAKRPWYNDLLQYWHGNEEPLKRLVLGLKPVESFLSRRKSSAHRRALAVLCEGEAPKTWIPADEGFIDARGRRCHAGWLRRMTPEERRDATFEFYKWWLAVREQSGGPTDPLFFGTDPRGLAKLKRSEIALLEFEACPGAAGVKMGALNEWRSYSPDNARLVAVDGKPVKTHHECPKKPDTVSGLCDITQEPLLLGMGAIRRWSPKRRVTHHLR
jgi:hypothetical protein